MWRLIFSCSQGFLWGLMTYTFIEILKMIINSFNDVEMDWIDVAIGGYLSVKRHFDTDYLPVSSLVYNYDLHKMEFTGQNLSTNC